MLEKAVQSKVLSEEKISRYFNIAECRKDALSLDVTVALYILQLDVTKITAQ